MKSNVRKQSECAVQLCRWRVERERAGFPTACRREVDTEECDLIGNVQALTARRAFAQHGRSKVCDSRLARRVDRAAASEKENRIRERKLVLLDDHQSQTIRELPRENWGKRYPRGRTQLGWLASVKRSLRGSDRLDGEQSQCARSSDNLHRPPPLTVSTVSYTHL